MARDFRRFDVFLVALDPAVGAEIQKTRPCLIVSPDEANSHLRTVVVVPFTTTVRPYPSRVPSHFGGKHGQLAVDQLRSVDKSRCLRRIGRLTDPQQKQVADTLARFFAL